MSTYVIQILAGIASASILFLVASGLTLVFGALRIANFAHGSLYMLGAFLMVSIGSKIGFSNTTFWLSMLLAAMAVAAFGALMEMTVLRPVYSRPSLTQMIVTFALVLIISGVVRVVYGPFPIRTQKPPLLEGSVTILGRGFPRYQLFLIGLAGLIAFLLWGLLHRTSLGRKIRAAVSDPNLLALSGVNVRWLFTGVFAIGAFLAGLAGVVVSSQGAAGLGMDIEVIVKAFVIVVIGGMGSLGGALVGSLLVGITESLSVLWIPGSSLVVIFALLVLVLALRPQGLFGRIEATSTQPASIRLPQLSAGRRRLSQLASALVRQNPSGKHVDRGLWILAGIGIGVGVLLPIITPVSTVLVATSALILALFALSYNLLLGTTGLVSFGHALLFGIGAYTVALVVGELGWPPLLALALTPVIGAGVAFVGGLIAFRATELYFALLTLGIAQVTFAGALEWHSLTGGTNGLHGVFTPSWLINSSNMYWFVFGFVFLCGLLLYVITRSPFGDALRSIRENRQRAEFTGLWLKRYELTAYVLAGAFGSIAGGLFALFQFQAHVGLLHWTTSAQPLIMSLLGGMGSFLGPVLGSFFYTFLNDFVAQRTVLWDLIIGAIVLIVALAMPLGLAGALKALVAGTATLMERRLGRRRAPATQ